MALGLVCGLALVAAAPIAAGPQPFPEITPKFVKPPAPGTTRRITVQIEPRPEPAVPPRPVRPAQDAEDGGPDAEAVAVAPGRPGSYAWFWDTISPSLSASGPGRLDDAMQTLAGATSPVRSPRLQHLQDIARKHGVDILRATIDTQVSPALVLAVISVESSGRTDAVSHAGASGLMQLMPATAERFGVTDTTQAAQNIQGGVKYLDWLMTHFQRDPILVLAGYNAGEGAVRDHQGVPPYAETRDYVPKVLAAFQVAKGLCRTPPELISDGCVFVSMN
ncbi:MAG: lytic transglycosylase domain-containing protein [Rhodobacteraceae bacterium]|nr:MAG: lytic transglycosylase domain-containing protein [Paracoccaceae bacterium]